MLWKRGWDGDSYCRDGVGMGTSTPGTVENGDKLASMPLPCSSIAVSPQLTFNSIFIINPAPGRHYLPPGSQLQGIVVNLV